MKCSAKFRNIAAGICLTALSGMVYADDTAANFELPTTASFYTDNFQSLKSRSFNAQSFNSHAYLLAANESDAVQKQADVIPAAEFKPPMFTARNAHQYLGLGTLALFGLTAVTAPDSEGNTKPQTSGVHQSLGRATATMAAATVMTGLLFHWDDVHFEDGFTDPDNLHAMIGTAGALAMLYAVSVAPGHGHSSAGIAGGVAMGVAIKLTW